MYFLRILFLLVLGICPLAYCYGQTHFSSVSGEGGYAAFQGWARLDADNGFILIPSFGYYRVSDQEQDERYSAGKGGLEVQYELQDNAWLFLYGDYVPRRVGFERISYQLGGHYEFCYRCGIFQHPYLQVSVGQVRYDINQYIGGAPYEGGFHTQSPLAIAQAGSEWGPMSLQLRYEKLIKYSHQPPRTISSTWMEIPFMTAIVQGFVTDVQAARLAYLTRWITPYVIYARYRYVVEGHSTQAWGGGVSVKWGKTTLSGGIENFESNWDSRHKNYYSVSASMEF